MSALNLPVCIICREQFDTDYKIPYTQPCNHTVCQQCILQQTIRNCPSDNTTIVKDDTCVNRPLLYYLFGTVVDDHLTNDESTQSKIGQHLIELARLLRDSLIDQTNKLSPQLSRRLLHLIESSPYYPDSRKEFLMRSKSVFNRLLLELIQTHYDTKEREHEFAWLIKKKGCSVIPNLTNEVISIIVKLYNAAQHPGKASHERDVLVDYIMIELSLNDLKLKRQVEKTLQTLYRCSCFHLIRVEGKKALFKLKEDLHSVEDLRQKHDTELIRLTQSSHIRLTAQSLAHLLHGSSHPDVVSRMQSLLDKHQCEVHVDELAMAVRKKNDSYGIGKYLNELRDIQDILNKSLIYESEIPDYNSIGAVLERLTSVKHLFSIRQTRGTIHKIM